MIPKSHHYPQQTQFQMNSGASSSRSDGPNAIPPSLEAPDLTRSHAMGLGRTNATANNPLSITVLPYSEPNTGQNSQYPLSREAVQNLLLEMRDADSAGIVCTTRRAGVERQISYQSIDANGTQRTASLFINASNELSRIEVTFKSTEGAVPVMHSADFRRAVAPSISRKRSAALAGLNTAPESSKKLASSHYAVSAGTINGTRIVPDLDKPCEMVLTLQSNTDAMPTTFTMTIPPLKESNAFSPMHIPHTHVKAILQKLTTNNTRLEFTRGHEKGGARNIIWSEHFSQSIVRKVELRLNKKSELVKLVVEISVDERLGFQRAGEARFNVSTDVQPDPREHAPVDVHVKVTHDFHRILTHPFYA